MKHVLCHGSKGMLRCALLLQKFSMTKQKKNDSSLQQLLNEQRVLRMPGFLLVILGGLSFGSFNIGSLNGKSMELCEELLRRKVGICCIQKSEVERHGFIIRR